MSVNGISYLNGYKPMYGRKSQENNQTPVSFGYGNDDYQSSVATSYIQKQQAQKQQMELEKQKKDKWKQFGLDVLKGVVIGAALIGGTALVASCTKAGREMAQSLTHHYGLSDAASDGASKFKTPETAGKNITADECEKMLGEVNIDKDQQTYILENICLANKGIKESLYQEGMETNTCGNRGAILYGRGGIGKSYAMEQIAKACGASYTSIKGNDFMNMYQGMSEGNLKGILLEAKAQAEKTPDKPVIIFLDEGESILGSGRTSGGNNTNAMLRSILLGAMETEGIDALPQNVKFIVTTNFVDDIDEPYRRDGRLGIPMELLCPSAAKQRDIMLAQFKKIFGKAYDKKKEIIEDYVQKRYEHMLSQEDKIKKSQYTQNIKDLKAYIDTLNENNATQMKNISEGLIKDNNKMLIEAQEALQKNNKNIDTAKQLISWNNNQNQLEDGADTRYFNFTPAEIKGLVNSFERLLHKGKALTVDNMIAIEENKIQALRANLRKMNTEHAKKALLM